MSETTTLPRITTPVERAPLYAAYVAARAEEVKVGGHCTDDSIIQRAVEAYDGAKYGTEKLMLPDWLIDLIEAAKGMADELGCDEARHADDKCTRWIWEALLDQVPDRTKVLVDQAIVLRGAR